MQQGLRGFAGGAKPKPIDPKETNFDIVFVGGINATALCKFVQQHKSVHNKLKLAVISPQGKYIQPSLYFSVAGSHIEKLNLDSGSVNAQVENWSKVEIGAHVTKINPVANELDLSNGKTFTYKALVLAPGLSHSMDYIPGLAELDAEPDHENTFVHMLDKPARAERNFFNGWNNFMGDLMCYSPAFPYKGEGSDFYALYYEHFLRTDKMLGRAHPGSRVQYWTPNKKIYQFDYANEVALDECHKRGIEVHFGWEMVEVKRNAHNQKIAVMKNVDSGEVIEKDFFTGCINPTSKPAPIIAESGLADANGMMDVNKYTLQHNKFENVFSFGDAVGFETTRTHNAAMAQNPVIKNNVIRFLQDKDCNGIYDGFSQQYLWLGHSYSTQFSHTHDFEPTASNHQNPHHGIFARYHFSKMLNQIAKADKAYSSFDKNQGPPHYDWCKDYDELEHNDYLASKSISPESLIHPARKQSAVADQ